MNFVHKIFIANPTAGPLVYVFVYTILYDRVVFLSIPTAGPYVCVAYILTCSAGPLLCVL